MEQILFADESAAGGNVNELQNWWNWIVKKGPACPAFGYYVNLKKTWLVVKEDQYENAVKCFEDTDVQITTSGKGYLGSTLGTSSFKETYVQLKVDK